MIGGPLDEDHSGNLTSVGENKALMSTTDARAGPPVDTPGLSATLPLRARTANDW